MTGRGDHGIAVMTISSLLCLSLDPPLLGFSVAIRSRTWNALRTADLLGLQLLTWWQAHLARQFAQRGQNCLMGVDFEGGLGGVPLIEGCSVWFLVRVTDCIQTGDHYMLVRAVDHVGLGEPAEPLLNVDGQLHTAA